MNRSIFTKAFLLALTVVILLGCATTGPGGKKSLILIDSATEVSIGHDADLQIRQQNRMLTDDVWNSYIDRIGQSIVANCDRKDIKYHFAIVDSNMVNAFATPGGYVYLYTGLLKAMDNEAELASVLAHEISHIVGRHGVKRLQTAMGVSLLQQLILGEDNTALNMAVGVALGLTFADYSRDNEREADSYGLSYMISTGYDPNASVTMFEKLATMSDGGPNFFEKLAMSHPETRERIANAKMQIESFKPMPQNLNINETQYQQMKARLR